ncbi:MAG TPA: bifunctional riboflavin kinase/FAD synthetase [Bacteroidia bacterium]|nr:bifunctional riboflavin kinase/FAD synthetase [Bacteroidia bacterium]
MKIYYSLENFPVLNCPVLTLGTFDGVHIGHQKILSRLNDMAKSVNGESVLMTFHPHPRAVIFPDQRDIRMISTLDEKIALLEQHGVEHLVVQSFTRDFSMLNHDTFIREYLVKKIGVKKMVIGYDHQFGHDRKGSFAELQSLAPRLGFTVEEIPEQDINDVAVSSTRIRKALFEGRVEDAAGLLGYNYTFSGRVVKGKQLGRKLGFPTANLECPDPLKLVPANGVYAVYVIVNNVQYKGVLSIGTRPTFDNGARSVEVNIFDFDRDIYGENVKLIFKNYLRSDQKFDGVDALIEQMHLDKARSLELL